MANTPNPPKGNDYEGAIDRGLEGVIACSSAISTIDGTTLIYRGYTIEDLAENATFEEVIHLLWFGTLPDAGELESLRGRLARSMTLPDEMRVWLLGMPKKVHPMDFLSAVVAGLTLHDPEANIMNETAAVGKAVRLTARIGLVVGAYEQARNGRWPIEADPTKSISWNILRGITGKAPTPSQERDFDVCLILHADHELNASAFSARVTASTLSGMYSSVLAAIGTLKGPLHGGANAAVMAMLRQIGSEDAIDTFLAHSFEKGDKIMGFGHRVYKNGDPRAKILRSMSERLTSEIGRPEFYRMSQKLEKLMGEKKGLIPNVDFYSATVYNALGIPDDLFTPIFAASRVAGWCAHIIEQYNNNRIYRPRARYIGRSDGRYVPIEKR